MIRRRGFLGLAGAVPALGGKFVDHCGCAMMPQAAAGPLGAEAFAQVGSKLRITNVKVFGVSLTPDSDRPYVFVKIETNHGVTQTEFTAQHF